LRAVYIPKDLNDFQYYPCNKNTVTSTAKARNNGGKPETDKFTITGTTANNAYNALSWPYSVSATFGNATVPAGTWPMNNNTPLNVDY
jgi:hypothetical protein